MNSGRGSTRLGDDAIPVWCDVPRWLAGKMQAAFRAAGVEFQVREGHKEIHDAATGEPTDFIDRFIFPHAARDSARGSEREKAAAFVQRIVDSVPESKPRGC